MARFHPHRRSEAGRGPSDLDEPGQPWDGLGPGVAPGQVGVWRLALVFLAVLALSLALTNVVATGFARLGLSGRVVALLVATSLAGSLVNIPLYARRFRSGGGALRQVGIWVFWTPPQIQQQVLAINLGGAVVPAMLSGWLVFQAPAWKMAVATLVIVLITYRIARVVPGKGIEMPVLVAPLFAAGLAWLLASGGGPSEAPAIAYVAGSMGTLIGADVLNLGRLRTVGSGVVSIGGAGVFDGVFLVGIVAVLLA